MKTWTEEKLWKATASNLPDTRDRAHTEIIRRLQERVANLQAESHKVAKNLVTNLNARLDTLESQAELQDEMLDSINRRLGDL